MLSQNYAFLIEALGFNVTLTKQLSICYEITEPQLLFRILVTKFMPIQYNKTGIILDQTIKKDQYEIS